jgi:hypothetical protein
LRAATRELLVSRTSILVAGSGLTSTERSVHHLKEISEDGRIFGALP